MEGHLIFFRRKTTYISKIEDDLNISIQMENDLNI